MNNRDCLRFLVSIVLICSIVGLSYADIVVTGSIVGEDNALLPGVMVKVKDNSGKTLSFSKSNESGIYSITVPDSIATGIMVVFDKLRYTRFSNTLESLRKTPDITLVPEGKTLEEIVVTPSKIRSHGDTVVYNVNAMKYASDRTIEDVIRRLPGVDVDNNGTIRYNGESINRFYIEGLDMLGGRYSLASKNINADDVSEISLYENHQPAKVLKGIEHSDKAALNLSLKKKSLLRPTGYVEGGSGASKDDVMWKGGLFSMLISPKSQTFITAKGSNFGPSFDLESKILTSNSLTASTPFFNIYSLSPLNGMSGLTENRFKRITSQNYSIITGTKPGDNSTFSVQASYSQTDNSWNGRSLKIYDIGENSANVEISQIFATGQKNHDVNLSLNYEYNGEKTFVSDAMMLQGTFSKGLSDIRDNSRLGSNQAIDSKMFTVTNNFNVVLRKGIKVWQLTNKISYSDNPDNLLRVRQDDSDEPSFSQYAASSCLRTETTTSFSGDFSKYMTVGVLLNFNTKNTYVDSYLLESGNIGRVNRNNQAESDVKLDLGPYMQAGGDILKCRVDIPVELRSINVRGIDHDFFNKDKFRDFDANIGFRTRVNYNPLQNLKMSFTISRAQNSGGLSNFITSPIYKDYRTMTVLGTGILQKQSHWNAGFSVIYRDMMKGLYNSLRVSAVKSKSNTLSALNVSPDGNETVQLDRPFHSTSLNGGYSFSKLIRNSTIRFNLSDAYVRSNIFRNNMEYIIHSNMMMVNGNASVPLFRQRLVLNPGIAYSYTTNSNNISTETVSHNMWNASFNASVFPHKRFEIKFSLGSTIDEMQNGDYLKYLNLDASMTYSYQRWQVDLKLNNLTNCRKMTRSLVGNMMLSESELSLRGFESLLTVRYSF